MNTRHSLMMGANTSASSDEARSYEPAMPYGNRNAVDTSQHRLQVPPAPVLFSGGEPVIDIDQGAPPAYSNDEFGTSAFMCMVARTRATKITHNMLTWKFQNRYEAQMIVPFLYLGPSTAARDVKFMDEAKISYLLAVRSSNAVRMHPKFLNPSLLPTSAGRQTGTFDIDTPYEFISNIRPTIKGVVDHLEASCMKTPIKSAADVPARVLVYCENGSDRSAVFVTAFLMVFYGLKTSSAIQLMQSQRFSITIDEGMKNMLRNLEDILIAERQVVVAQLPAENGGYGLQQASSEAPTLSAPKRTLSRMEEEDEDFAGEQWSQAQRRAGIAPFRDITP